MNGIFYAFPSRYGLREPLDVKEFATSGSYIPPRGAKRLTIIMVGGGGGGGSARRAATVAGERAGGGGGGWGGILARHEIWIRDIGDGTQLNITIGAGGAGGARRTTGTVQGLAGSNGGRTTITIPGRPGFLLEVGGGAGGGAGSVISSGSENPGINISGNGMKVNYMGIPNSHWQNNSVNGTDTPSNGMGTSGSNWINWPSDLFYRAGTNNCGAGGGGCCGAATSGSKLVTRGGHIMVAYGDTAVVGSENTVWRNQGNHNPLQWSYRNYEKDGSTAFGGTADLVMLWGGTPLEAATSKSSVDGSSFLSTGIGPEIGGSSELNPYGVVGNFTGIGGAGGGGGWSADTAGDGGDGWRGGGGGGGGGISNAVSATYSGAGGAGGNGYVFIIAE